ncbi:MAG: hypothetical protein J7L96_09275 [Bacteroidales bacterium]|nr:hypothetical protein [Bacteroidales bacterium]
MQNKFLLICILLLGIISNSNTAQQSNDFVIQDLTSGLKMVVLANSDMLSRPFQLEHGNFLQSPVAQIFLRTLCFPGGESPDITNYKAEAWNKIRIATGEKRAVSILARFGLALIFLILISALILWPLAWLLRKPWKKKTRKLFRAIRYGRFFTFSRYFTSVLVIIYLLVSSMLGRHSELIYRTDFPGIVDGVSLYQNIVIALPAVLAILYPLQIIWLIRVWTGKFGTFNWRIQYSLISLALLGYIVFLINWNLVYPGYYINRI